MFPTRLKVMYTYTPTHLVVSTSSKVFTLHNCALWNTLKHIINILKLNVSLIKVKAHSGHPLNDAADMLAKEGRPSKEYLQINIQHIKTQPCHLKFNDTIIIDRNIRKTIKRMINFQYFERHLAHQNLHKLNNTLSITLLIGNTHNYGSNIIHSLNRQANNIQNMSVGG
jgi:hypothetical protein